MLTSEQIIRGITDAFISSNEETIFGNWLEGLAIFVNEKVYQGWKSGIQGIDLEFNNAHIRYIVAIKSGPNWGNSSQIAKMKSDFTRASRTLRTSNSNLHITAINGCCYGVDHVQDKGVYYKYCGQRFWHLISGNEYLYTDLIEPLGRRAKECNDAFQEVYAQVINAFTRDFSNEFCLHTGEIDWHKFVRFNSEG